MDDSIMQKHRNTYKVAHTKNKKQNAIAYKGGKCQRCNYRKTISALEFHHRDPNDKLYSWSEMRGQKWDVITKELDKCDLLCANCHREVHEILRLVEEANEDLDDRIRRSALFIYIDEFHSVNVNGRRQRADDWFKHYIEISNHASF